MLAGDALGHRHAFFLGLVRQHRPAHDVADRPHARQVGAALVVDDDGAALVELQAHGLGVQADRCCGTRPIDTIKRVDLERCGLRPWHRCRLTDTSFFVVFDLGDLDAELELQALLGEDLLRFLGHLPRRPRRGRLGSASSIVTSAPSRRHTEPISRPMTPEPTTPSVLGTPAMRSAPSLDRMLVLVEGHAGQRHAGSSRWPRSRAWRSASRWRHRPRRSRSRHRRSSTNEPRPWKNVTLFFLNR